ncbi:membrane protein [Pectobacterium phage vB_PcaM_CBB]|uniref:Putative membrane protein n=1 Tax=Pectobacterium phage vB_PcaM_CBB TaxID=2772511 RepID=A0A1L2CUJ6_9CAUD|nr:membrane protein [Pectobacterium phage vB_PcaM_CBB]AMM43691.1 putative membrane protein [Pectobacterium phage vB_PcaM_CBB]
MTFFIVLGMVVLFVIGLLLIVSSVASVMFIGAFSGRVSFSEFIVACIMFGIGVIAWYLVFSNVSIGIG